LSPVYRPSMQQLDSLIDIIVEALAREIEEEGQALLATNAAPPTRDERGILENTQHGDHN
jgi:hypothetical protein